MSFPHPPSQGNLHGNKRNQKKRTKEPTEDFEVQEAPRKRLRMDKQNNRKVIMSLVCWGLFIAAPLTLL